MSNSAAPKITIEHRYLDVVLYEYQPTKKEQASGLAMRAALETACLSGANLNGANLSGANLYGAYMSGAHLSGANFYRANLDGTYLRGAYLDGAYLYGAYLDSTKNLIGDRPVFTLGPIGSRCDYFTAYLTDKGVYLHAGCFFGTVAEFVARLEREHGTNKHWQEYSAALALIECHARLWTPDASQAAATAEEA
jgi:hypothetical protein